MGDCPGSFLIHRVVNQAALGTVELRVHPADRLAGGSEGVGVQQKDCGMSLSKKDEATFNTIVTRLRADDPRFAPAPGQLRRRAAVAVLVLVASMAMLVAATAADRVWFGAAAFAVAVAAAARLIRTVQLLRGRPMGRTQTPLTFTQRIQARWNRRQPPTT